MAQITSGGEVLSSAHLRDPQARCPLVAIFRRPHPMFRHASALPCGATIKAQISRWTHHKHRTPSSKTTETSMWTSNVLRVGVVLLWALPTLRAAECAALNPTESAAKDGRCLYGKPRGEGECLF